jgi:hypothetical protein
MNATKKRCCVVSVNELLRVMRDAGCSMRLPDLIKALDSTRLQVKRALDKAIAADLVRKHLTHYQVLTDTDIIRLREKRRIKAHVRTICEEVQKKHADLRIVPAEGRQYPWGSVVVDADALVAALGLEEEVRKEER